MIILGEATIVGSSVTIAAPVGGFGGVQAVRISNYTGFLLQMGDITGDSPGSQQYILPFQQNVYQVHNVRQPPQVSAVGVGTNFDTASLLIEWSTEPETDYPGIYPCALTQAALLSTGNKGYTIRYEGGSDPVTDGLHYHGDAFNVDPPFVDSNSLEVIATDVRLSATIINEGTVQLKYSAQGGVAADAYVILYPGMASPPGSALSIDNGSHITIAADMTDPGVVFSIFGEASF